MDNFDMTGLQRQYPGVYDHMEPYAQQVVNSYGNGRNLTSADINRMANEVLLLSKFPQYPPAGYNNDSLNNVARLLVLMSLYNNHGYNIKPPHHRRPGKHR